MRKIAIVIFILLTATISSAQTSSGTWNSRTATYTNTNHGLTWKLIDDWTWVGRPILAESTLFKVRNDDTHILIKLGATKGDNGDVDAWDYISMFRSEQYMNMIKTQAKQNGMTFLGSNVVKSQLCGNHAVKTRSDMKKYYADYDQTVHSIEISYSLCKNGYVYTVTVTALSVLEEEISDFDRIATTIFNGFKIN